MPNQRTIDDNNGRSQISAARHRVVLKPLSRQDEKVNFFATQQRQTANQQHQPSAMDLLIKAGATTIHRTSTAAPATANSNGSLNLTSTNMSTKRPADHHDELAQAHNTHKKTRQSTITVMLQENSMINVPPVCAVNKTSAVLSQKTNLANQPTQNQANSTTEKDLKDYPKKALTNTTTVAPTQAHQHPQTKVTARKSHQHTKLPEITKLIERRIKSISLDNSSSSISSSKLTKSSSQHSSSSSCSSHSETSLLDHSTISEHEEPLDDGSDEVEILREIRLDDKRQPRQSLSDQRQISRKGHSLIARYETPELLVKNPHIKDHDKTQLKDSYCEPHYAWDIFKYYRHCESIYATEKYLNKHKPSEINAEMRAVLVDWMVEVQESFEMNHETLYLAVKIMDRYLMNKSVKKSTFQLLGITSLLIAAKFDERIPPAITDFVYTCDSAFTKQQVIKFEIEVLKTLDFFIGFPLSYRFLRRYARCCDCDFHTLTLARFILEMSLMEYDLIEEPESKIAAAALFLAIEMLSLGPWTETFEFYSGYSEEDLIPLMWKLNDMISAPKKQHLSTVRTKYEHQAFMQVAKIRPLPPQ